MDRPASEKPWWRQPPPWPMWFRLFMGLVIIGGLIFAYSMGYNQGYDTAMADAVAGMREGICNVADTLDLIMPTC